MNKLIITSLALASLVFSTLVQAQSLKGSRASMQRQHGIAVADGFAFLEVSQVINRYVERGELLRVSNNSNLVLHDVSNPFARPATKLLLDRLSAQYRAACGEKLTVTSLVRPKNRQPANAAPNSVHPTGMAVDLRIPRRSRCRSWLEQTLLSLEGSGVLDVTRERNPPHYHVAVFTTPYVNYVANLTNSPREYRVRSGDTLSRIARNAGISVAQLRAANGIRGDLININQRLLIPASGDASGLTLASNSVPTISNIDYKVRKGDSLWRIASRHDTSVDQLKRENGLHSNFLKIGQVISITPGGAD